MTKSTNLLLIGSGASLLIKKLKADLRPLRRKRVHFIRIALPELVLLDLLLRAQPILEPICDRIGVIGVQMAILAHLSAPLPLAATLHRSSLPYYPLFK